MLYSCFEQAFGNEENDGGKKIKMIPLNKKKKKKLWQSRAQGGQRHRNIERNTVALPESTEALGKNSQDPLNPAFITIMLWITGKQQWQSYKTACTTLL